MRGFAILLLVLSPAILSAQTADVVTAVGSITEADFYHRVGVIAHDSMMGRDTPSPGLDMTARWIGEEFRRFGLEPGGENGTFLQQYAVESVTLDMDNSVFRFSGGESLSFGEDVLPLYGAPSGLELEGGITLLAGAGDSSDVAEEDIRGRHLLVLPPAGSEEAGLAALYGLFRGVMGFGPASISVVDGVDDARWQERVARLRPSTRIPWQDQAERRFPTLLRVREGSLARVLASHGVELASLAAGPEETMVLPLEGESLTIQVQPSVSGGFTAPNTVGILRGSDPELRDEYVVFSAHMDHVGVGSPNAEGDSIYNGADDDASGTVAVVELAEAFAMLAPAPRRSIIFLAVSGEEKGLWGSAYFASNPPVPVESLVANLNADMIARNWPDSIVVIGKEHSDLGETLEEVAAEHPELGMVPMDDIWPEEGFYSRSDHFNFAVKGVPILFFFNGPHEDYHEVTDELERIDAEKAARITQLMFYLGLEVANDAQRPVWDPESYREIVGRGG